MASVFKLTEAGTWFGSEAAAPAASEIGEEILGDLERLVEVMATSSGDEADAANREFHPIAAKTSENTVVRYIIGTLWKTRNEFDTVNDVYDSVCERSDRAVLMTFAIAAPPL